MNEREFDAEIGDREERKLATFHAVLADLGIGSPPSLRRSILR